MSLTCLGLMILYSERTDRGLFCTARLLHGLR
jgi:hypothetical protein